MKIRITQTIIEFDFEDEQEQNVPKPTRPFSFFDLLRKEAEKAMYREPQEDKFHGQFLP